MNLSKMFDGDIYGQTPVNAKVLKEAVTIIGPPD
jgi:diacylglycerol kinase family enzyme